MRLLPLLFLVSIQCVFAKNNVKSLTESMGQEVIEMGAPVKDLPPDLEEEPSAESDEEDKVLTTIPQLQTKKDLKKTATTTPAVDSRRKMLEKSGLLEKERAEEEEARIEKELAEIYKDNTDYKADSAEKEIMPLQKLSIQTQSNKSEEKPPLRSKANFNFQPNVYSKAEVEKFRTSVDDISCGRTRLSGVTGSPGGNGSSRNLVHFIITMIPLALIGVFK